MMKYMANPTWMVIKFSNPDVEDKFMSYSEPVRSKLLFLRHLVLETALETNGVGELEEALKWGQPSFLTNKTKSGSTIRVDKLKSQEGKYAMYFICNTNLVERFQEQYPTMFHFDGNRALIFDIDDEIPVMELKDCIAQALTYHKNKRR